MIYIRMFLPAILSAIAIIVTAVKFETRKRQWALTYFVAVGVYVLTYKPVGPLNAFNLTAIASAITYVFLHFYLEKREKEKAEEAERKSDPAYIAAQEAAKQEEEKHFRENVVGRDLMSRDELGEYELLVDEDVVENEDPGEASADTDTGANSEDVSSEDDEQWIGYDK